MTKLNTEQLKQLQSDVNQLNRRYNRLFGKLFKMLPSDYAKNPLIHVTVDNENHKDQTEIIYSIFPDLFHIETKITTDAKHFEESTSQQRRETLFILPTGSIINTVLQASQDEFKDYFSGLPQVKTYGSLQAVKINFTVPYMQSCNLVTEPLRTDSANILNIEYTWREPYMQKLVPSSFRISFNIFNLLLTR